MDFRKGIFASLNHAIRPFKNAQDALGELRAPLRKATHQAGFPARGESLLSKRRKKHDKKAVADWPWEFEKRKMILPLSQNGAIKECRCACVATAL